MEPRFPALFIGHGSPMNALEDNPASRAWRALGRRLPRPAAILCLSAHWETEGWQACSVDRPRTIHDFRGFPPDLHAFSYPAPGAPALAATVCELLGDAGCRPTKDWGLDHGAWSVLAHLFPAADVPVAQLSLNRKAPLADFVELGRRLAPLRREGVLLLGSGNVVHNLGRLTWGDAEGREPWALAFDAWVRGRIRAGDLDALTRPEAHPDGALAVPTREHYLPLLPILAAGHGGEPQDFPCEGVVLGSLSMLAVRVGSPLVAWVPPSSDLAAGFPNLNGNPQPPGVPRPRRVRPVWSIIRRDTCPTPLHWPGSRMGVKPCPWRSGRPWPQEWARPTLAHDRSCPTRQPR